MRSEREGFELRELPFSAFFWQTEQSGRVQLWRDLRFSEPCSQQEHSGVGQRAFAKSVLTVTHECDALWSLPFFFVLLYL